MLNQNNKNLLQNKLITLNYNTWDIEDSLVTTSYIKLEDITKFAISYIIEKHKEFSYLLNKQLELSLVITNDNNIKEVNHRWQNILKSTNVLSMGLFSEEDVTLSDLVLLGDVIISIETAIKEAEIYNITLENHLIRLLVHGILHIFGFDHKNSKDAKEMHDLENTILQKFTKDLQGLTINYWD